MEFTRYWGQAGGAEESGLNDLISPPFYQQAGISSTSQIKDLGCHLATLGGGQLPQGGSRKRKKETPGPAGAGAEGHRKKNMFSVSEKPEVVKEGGIETPHPSARLPFNQNLVRTPSTKGEGPKGFIFGEMVFWPCCRNVICGTVVGESRMFDRKSSVWQVRTQFGNLGWFPEDKLFLSRRAAEQEIRNSYLHQGEEAEP